MPNQSTHHQSYIGADSSFPDTNINLRQTTGLDETPAAPTFFTAISLRLRELIQRSVDKWNHDNEGCRMRPQLAHFDGSYEYIKRLWGSHGTILSIFSIHFKRWKFSNLWCWPWDNQGIFRKSADGDARWLSTFTSSPGSLSANQNALVDPYRCQPEAFCLRMLHYTQHCQSEILGKVGGSRQGWQEQFKILQNLKRLDSLGKINKLYQF